MPGPFQSQSPQDAVKATSSMSDGVRKQLNHARADPAKELGMTQDEMEARKREAAKPHKYRNEQTSREFDVKSSARAQQVMSKGIDKMQREKRQRELKGNMKILRKFQILLSVFSVMFVSWITLTFLLPQYAAVQDRNRRMQLRYERAQTRLTEYAAENHLEKDSLPPTLVVSTGKPPRKQTIE